MTVQGPVKEQQPDGTSHRGGGGGCHLSRPGPDNQNYRKLKPQTGPLWFQPLTLPYLYPMYNQPNRHDLFGGHKSSKSCMSSCAGFVFQEQIRKGGGGLWGVPQRAAPLIQT